MRILFFTIFFIVSCSQDEIVTEQTLTVFEDQKILFDTGLINNDTEIIRTLGSGRVVLKKIELPENDNFHRAKAIITLKSTGCLLYTSPSPRDRTRSRMPSSA